MSYLNKRRLGRNNCFIFVQQRDHRPDLTVCKTPKKLDLIYGEPKLNELPIVRVALDFFDSGNVKTVFDIDAGPNFISKPNPDYTDIVYSSNGKIDVINYSNEKEIPASIIQNSKFIIGGGFSILQNGIESYEGIEHFEYYSKLMPRTILCSTDDDKFVILIIDKGYNSSVGATAKDCYNTVKFMENEMKLKIKHAINYFDGKYPEAMEYDTYACKSFTAVQKNVKTAFIVYSVVLPTYNALLPILKINGSCTKGVYVHLAQRIIQSVGIPVGPLDGIFGALTQDGIREYQKVNKLRVDGVIGKDTWRNLLEYANKKCK